MKDERKIKLLEPTSLTAGGKIQPKDTEHTVSTRKARHLVTHGKAKYVAETAKSGK